MAKQRDKGPDDVEEGNWLDAEHNAMIERVLNRDTKAARRELARLLGAELTGDIEGLREQQKLVGTTEQMSALRASGWEPWSRFFVIAAWVIALLDALLWAVGAARVLTIK
jgi:hypothetical protein